ncbi:MAG: TetR/AcrR family transcriptional regulator, partial [Nocardioides sp.]
MSTTPTTGADAAPAARRRNDSRREKTPIKLVAAARIIFERDGFFDARLADITSEAQVASGTLYRYYRSKHEIFGDVMAEVVEELTAVTPE